MAYPEEVPDSSGELHREWRRLRGCMRDLVAFGGLRALWSGQPTASIVESFADALLSLVHAELVMVRLQLTSGAQVVEVLRTAHGTLSAERSRQAARRLAPLLDARSVGLPLRVESPLGRGPLFLAVVPLGHETEFGFLAVGSPAAGFPDDLQRALVGIATSQVAVALKERELFELMSRKRAEKAQRESEVRFRAVFDGALDAMLIADDAGRCVEANPAACDLLGRAREELLGRPVASLSAAEMEHEAAWNDFRRQGRAAGEWRVRRADGATRDVEYTGTANFLPGLHLAVLRDITERKAVDADLRRQTELLQTIFDLSPVMISFVNSSGGIEWVNREWERALGWTLAEARELDLSAALPDPADREEALIFLRDLPPGWRDFRLHTKDGRVVDMAFANVRLSDGRIISFGQDVTERKRTEAERERRARQLQGLADAAIGIGAATSVARIAEIVTEAARRLIGAHAAVTRVRRNEASARLLSARSFSAEHSARAGGALESPTRGLHRMVCQSNRPWRRAQELGVPLTGRDGGNLGSIAVAGRYAGDFDADDEAILVQLARIAAEATENARLLEEVTAARERLAALSRRLVDLQEEERRTIARELHDEVGQILTGLHLMLETSRRGAVLDLSQVKDLVGQLQERVRDLSLNLRPPMLDDLGLVPALLWHVERYRAQTGIAVRFHHRGLAARLPSRTEMAAYRIVQEALTNVARHAEVAEATVDLAARGRWLELRVEDEGRGFDPAALAGPSSGLTGMRERALLAGGTLALESRPGCGARLLARLPMTIPQEP
jgi:PAS domain S-box-containing protein